MRLLIFSLLLAAVASASAQTSTSLHMVDRFLPPTVSRDRVATAPVDMVMLHFCSDVIENPDNPFNVDRIVDIFTSYTVSAHYLIGRDGTVYRFVPENRVAFHAGRGIIPWMPERANKLNEFSIGIEMLNVGSAEDMKIFMKPEKYKAYAAAHRDWIGYTDAQYKALHTLLTEIQSRHPAIKLDRKHIIGHSEYAGKARRTDPGSTFDWKRIGITGDSVFPAEPAEPALGAAK